MKKKVKSNIKATYARGSIIKEFMQFLWEAKLWWLAPMLVIFLLFGLLIIFAETSPVAPFIYTLF